MTAKLATAPLRAHLHVLLRSQFTLFLVVGGTAAAVNFLVRILINQWMSYAWAIIVAFCISLAIAFVLNRLFVFKKSKQSMRHQATWFVLVNLFALAQTLGVSMLLATEVFPALSFHWHTESVAHMIGIALPLISSYFGHKHLSFRH